MLTIQKVNKVRAKRSKRGISEMIAAIILVIITIAIGAGVYIYVTGLVNHN
jgi:flagellin-like protein